MGVNVGTSVTNTIVSIVHIRAKDKYRRAFAGATLHGCFNMLTVLILLPIEALTGMLKLIATWAAGTFVAERHGTFELIQRLTDPVTSRIVNVDMELVKHVAKVANATAFEIHKNKSMIAQQRTIETHLFMDTPLDDVAAGVLVIVLAFGLLFAALLVFVHLLQGTLKGLVASLARSLLNLKFQRCPFLADYVLLVFGIGVTIVMQSSSVATSMMTPLVGIGLVSLKKAFPFTVGANIGGGATGMIGALASSNLQVGMQVALVHLLFNIFGMVFWFLVPVMQRVSPPCDGVEKQIGFLTICPPPPP